MKVVYINIIKYFFIKIKLGFSWGDSNIFEKQANQIYRFCPKATEKRKDFSYLLFTYILYKNFYKKSNQIVFPDTPIGHGVICFS